MFLSLCLCRAYLRPCCICRAALFFRLICTTIKTIRPGVSVCNNLSYAVGGGKGGGGGGGITGIGAGKGGNGGRIFP